MIKKSKIYTKSGDKGKTSLLGGERVSKANCKIALYGEIDELNSFVGHYTSILDKSRFSDLYAFLQHIQKNLFEMSSYFACETAKTASIYKLQGVLVKEVESLEASIDVMENELIPLKNFILPGGDPQASFAHICRSVTRRVERCLARYIDENDGSEALPTQNQLIFLNRLSDYFFVLSRWVNFKVGVSDISWRRD